LPDNVLRELHFIDQNATGQILIDEPTIGEPDKDRYIISSLMEEAIASSILEGAATTRKKAKEMLREGRKPQTRGELMIQNNYATMKKIKDRISEKLSIELLCELQESMTKGTLEDPSASGRLRKPDEIIQVIDVMDGTILHTPPPAEHLKERLKKLCDFANESLDVTFIHPVIKGIILHFWMAYEHPFVDGNGRTARAIFYWYLLKSKYWLIEYLPISRIILKAPSKYKMAFIYSEKDQDDITYFIMFNLRAFHLSIEDLRKYVSKKQRELKEAGKLVRRLPGLNHRQQEVVNHAIHHPDSVYTILSHMTIHGIVYQTARADLLELVKRDILVKEREGRLFVFYSTQNLPRILKLGRSGTKGYRSPTLHFKSSHPL
jgi:Fic family protein